VAAIAVTLVLLLIFKIVLASGASALAT